MYKLLAAATDYYIESYYEICLGFYRGWQK